MKNIIIYLIKELNTSKNNRKMTTVTRTFDKDEKNHKHKQEIVLMNTLLQKKPPPYYQRIL